MKGFAAYVVFTGPTALLLRLSLRHPRVAVGAILILSAAAVALAMRRARHTKQEGLIFEDQLPTEVTPLRLSAD